MGTAGRVRLTPAGSEPGRAVEGTGERYDAAQPPTSEAYVRITVNVVILRPTDTASCRWTQPHTWAADRTCPSSWPDGEQDTIAPLVR
jgi:hypothetical protein